MDNLERSIDIRDALSQFSVIASLREAFSKTLSREFIKLIWPAYLIIMAISLLNFEAGQFSNFFATIAVTTAWLNHLNFAEPLQLTFRKRELRYTGWMLIIAFATGTALTLFMLCLSAFLKIGFPDFIMYGLLGYAFILTLLLIYPFMELFISLIALDYRHQGLLKCVKEMILPIYGKLVGGYFFIWILKGAAMALIVNIFNFPMTGNEESSFALTIFSLLILTALNYLAGGISAAFSSHILYSRAILKRG